MENKLRLAVVEAKNDGGLIHYTYQLCTALSNEGLDVTLLTGTDYELESFPHNFRVVKTLRLWRNYDQQASAAQPQNARVRFFTRIFRGLRRGIRALYLVFAWLKLTSHLMRLKPDIIQFTKIEFPFEAIFLWYLHRRGFILTQICHEFESRESRSKLASLGWKIFGDVYSYFSAIFFHANENRDRFFSIYPLVPNSITHIIPHGNSRWLLDIPARPTRLLRNQYGLKEDDPVILFFGLLAPSKGLEDLIDAFKIASRSCSARLIVAGFPTKHINVAELLARVESYDLADRVMFDMRYIPFDEIRPLMDLATVVVYPYHSSTQSGALQAAYIFGRPVIATTVGGLPEAVDDGKSGFLVSPHAPDQIAEKILTLIHNPDLAGSMGDYARHLADTRFSWQAIAQQIEPIYKSLLLRAGKTRL
ncbi:MAG TPA: glycosyltransferase family 4 protein [Anaerolineales bacterium]|nr:glycosyltransferase family 4 protein [Anaerolineales bacterium]